MKKKKTLYMMLPLVVLVWGFVVYQLFGSFFSAPSYAKEEVIQIASVDEIKKDTFLIVADYRDPFLGKKAKSRKLHSAINNAVSIPKGNSKKVKSEKVWPIIAYKGMIKNNNSNKRVGILSVEGKEHLIKETDIVSEITILSINKREVSVRFQKETKTITK
jgi:hypothetical protein